ncbi:MAG: hypothetical protein HZA50_13855 [Planctomycetes bacterium]|nr:hypothetical protein [Planctomycetota bacterium]
MMDNDLFQKLFVRYMAGEKVTSLAKEAGIPWQRLWGLLNDRKQNQPKDESQPKDEDRQQKTGNAIVRDSDGIDRITFDSIGQSVVDAMADYAQNEGNRKLIAQSLDRHTTGRDSWANRYTRKKLLDAVQNPPKHLMDAVDEMRQSLMDEANPPVASRRRIRRNQEWGDELEAEKVLTRSFTPWDRMTREAQPRRSVTIGVNLTVHCRQRAEDLLWRGAAAAALADILTQRGVNVEIVAFWTIGKMSSMSRMVVSRYVIKRADMPLDLGSVAVALAEIAYARLVALYGLARHVPGKLDESMGVCETLPAQDRSGIDYLAESNITNRTAAENWLKTSASRQEGEVLHV